mmetsp:Transcript_5251/g.10364  ORF Transcript_5251/g.10364 Transcript_5251/m.10364 type:complete len:99 (+) Transcript_5251:289-585(+)
MQRFFFLFLSLLVVTLGRRLPKTPSSPCRGAWGLPGKHPFACWGVCDEICKEEMEVKIEENKDDKAIKQVKRTVKKPEEQNMHDVRWGIVQDMLDGLE